MRGARAPRTRATPGLLAAVAVAAVAAAPAHARLLLEDQGAEVSTAGELRCGAPVAVEVTSEQPELFASGSARMQGLLDATRAMLGFECRNIPEIQVTGYLRGLSQPSYQASASAATSWRLAATRTVRAPAASPGVGAAPAVCPRAASTPAAGPPAVSRYAIRDLTTGMTVEAAMDTARRGFDATPRYDARTRVLSVVRGSCEVAEGSRPQPGWVCLKAQFSEGADPRTTRVSYAQTVDKDQGRAIADQLRDRFGAAAVDQELRSGSWLRGGEAERRLAWGAEIAGSGGEPRRELEALIRVEGDATVLVLDLVHTGSVSGGPRYQVRF